MSGRGWCCLIAGVLALSVAVGTRPESTGEEARTVRLSDVRIRDPFILPDEATKTYYLCVSHSVGGDRTKTGVAVYTSKDLETWRGPLSVFEVPSDFWGQKGVWAPELHAYRGKYYIFTTFDTDDKFPDQWPNWLPRVKRGSQVLVGDSPMGPFRPFRNRSHTATNLMTLDGTLRVEDGVRYMVYCHEWVQIKDGTVELVRLKEDLSDVEGEPVTLFKGSDALWARPLKEYPGAYVTDGPFLYRTKTGKLLMVWSSFGEGGYTTGIAMSRSGKVKGPWRQAAEPLFSGDGGHGMIFRKFDGTLMLVLHQPNCSPNERARLFELEDTGETVKIKNGR